MNQPTISVKLFEKADLNDLAIIADGRGESHLHLFHQHGDLSILKNALLHMTFAVELTDERHPEKPRRLSNLGVAQGTRFKYLGDQSDLDNAISNMEQAVQLTGDGDPSKPASLTNLALNQKNRFEKFGHLADLEKTISIQKKTLDLTYTVQPNKQHSIQHTHNHIIHNA
jgi:hypothetical protein